MAEIGTQMRAGWRVTWIGVAVNAGLSVVKLAAGMIGHSHALVTDAAHSLSDLITDAVVLVGLKAGRRQPDTSHPFGHGRIETLASSLVALTLIGVAVFFAVGAIERIVHGRFETAPSWYTIAAAAAAIVSKESLYRYTARVGRRICSAVLVANAWHHRSDALSSVAVLVGLVGAQLHPSLRVLDGYAAIVVAILIVRVGLSILWGSVKEITDTAPPEPVLDSIRRCVVEVPDVRGVHGLKVRTVGGRYQIELDIEVDGSITVAAGHAIAVKAEAALRASLEGISNIIVHVDTEADESP